MDPRDELVPSYVSARAEIIAAYVQTWAHETLSGVPPTHPALPPRLVYLDLYGGRSRRSPASRAVLKAIARRASEDPILCAELVLFLNFPGPEDPEVTQGLRLALAPAERMTHAPQLFGQHHWARIDSRLDAVRPLSTVAYVEPAGYEGLAAGDPWRCLRRPLVELWLTVRYPLINMGAGNQAVHRQLDLFWGERRALDLREELAGLRPPARQERIVAACADRLRERGAAYVLPFCLRDEHRCQELLFHATRQVEAHIRAKEVLARFSTGRDQGVPDYTWDPVAAHYDEMLPVMRPLDVLVEELGRTLANQVVTVEEVHRHHHLGRPYVLENYRDALDRLVVEGRALRLGNRIRVLR